MLEANNLEWEAKRTSAEQYERYKRTALWIENYYKNVIESDEYMPVVREGYEVKLCDLEFFTVYVISHPEVSAEHKWINCALAMQMAFWLGYKEGKSVDVEVPDVFKKM